MHFIDNRRCARAEADFPVIVESGLATSWVVHAVNVSQGGILIWSVRPLSQDIPSAIHFPFQMDQGFTPVKILRRDGYNYGCRFVDLPQAIYEALGRLVHKCSQHRRPRTLQMI